MRFTGKEREGEIGWDFFGTRKFSASQGPDRSFTYAPSRTLLCDEKRLASPLQDKKCHVYSLRDLSELKLVLAILTPFQIRGYSC